MVFDKSLMTAASNSLPIPCLVKLTDESTGKTVTVLVNDRGPHDINSTQGREMDLSEAAAAAIGIKEKGTATLSIKLLKNETDRFLKQNGLPAIQWTAPSDRKAMLETLSPEQEEALAQLAAMQSLPALPNPPLKLALPQVFRS